MKASQAAKLNAHEVGRLAPRGPRPVGGLHAVGHDERAGQRTLARGRPLLPPRVDGKVGIHAVAASHTRLVFVSVPPIHLTDIQLTALVAGE